MKVKALAPRLTTRDYSELVETADSIGEFIQYWGFKRVHGRIWACLFLLGEPLHCRQLSQILRISPSLVCISVAELIRYEVILEAGKGPNGVLLYRANPEIGSVIAKVLQARERELLQRIRRSAAQLSAKPAAPKPGHPRLDPVKVRALNQWAEIAQAFLDNGIDFVKASL